LHLGEFLYTGKDFIIIDFEGEASRPLSDRRRKRSAIRDVASVVLSFHTLAMTALFEQLRAGALGERDYRAVEPFANVFHTWSSWAYLKGYLETAGRAPFAPKDRDELRVLLDAFRLEKALSLLEHALYQRPDLIRVHLHAIEQVAPHLPHG
jgi:maltose alpha-D-glucosyltransferase/alpha-amylase